MMGIRVVIIGIIVFFSSSAAFGQVVSVSQLACSPSSLNSGASTTCTLTLNGAAPAGGTEVLLSSNNTLLLPGSNSVIVPAGTTSTTFTATAGSISANQTGTLTATAQHTVSLGWSASLSPNLMNYRVYRGTTSGGPYGVVTTLGLVTTYMDSNVQNAQTYYYVTTVVDAAGTESAYSNEASAIVPNVVSQSATVSLAAPVVTPVTLSSLVCSPTSVNSGSATTCSVTLNQAAPNGGTVVNLASSNNLLPVPVPSVTVPANTTSATFTATAGNIVSNQTATLTSSLNGASRTATINLMAPQLLTLSSLTCNPTTLNAGAITTCTVGLSGAAPNAGTVVSVASNNNLLPVPAPSVTIPVNTTSATFTATAGSMASNQSATLTATLNGASKAATISLVAPQSVILSSLTCNPMSLRAAATTTCTVALSGAAPNEGTVVNLASNSDLLPLTVPSVIVPANASSTAFTATAGNLASNQSATLTASLNGASKAATISLVAPQSVNLPGAIPSSLACSPRNIRPGATAVCTLKLSQTASAGGTTVALATNNGLLTVPPSITVAAGSSSTTFSVTASYSTSRYQRVRITASSGGASTSVFVTIQRGRSPANE